jgi:hypothetical protein
MKPIICSNMDDILKRLQATEFPWCDTGIENQRIIFAWGQRQGLESLDFETVRAAIHNLGPGALESPKAPVAPVVPPPAAPETARPP